MCTFCQPTPFDRYLFHIERNTNIIAELANYDFIEAEYVGRYYPEFKIVRTVVLYGRNEERVVKIEVGFLLNRRGKLVLGIQAPALFTTAIKNLLDYWAI